MAQQVRSANGIDSYRLTRSDLRRIYKTCGIEHFDLWPPKGLDGKFKKLRGAYFCDACGCSVMIDRNLPDEPAVFTMAHELKHHLMDSAEGLALFCDESNINQHIEIGAEIFAAELIFPDENFLSYASEHGLKNGQCSAEELVHLKRATNTTLSFSALSKRAEFHGLAARSSLSGFKGWKMLEERLYGEPDYKRILRYRKNQS